MILSRVGVVVGSDEGKTMLEVKGRVGVHVVFVRLGGRSHEVYGNVTII